MNRAVAVSNTFLWIPRASKPIDKYLCFTYMAHLAFPVGNCQLHKMS